MQVGRKLLSARRPAGTRLCACKCFLPRRTRAQALSVLLIIRERLENLHVYMKYLPVFTYNFLNYVETSFLKHVYFFFHNTWVVSSF